MNRGWTRGWAAAGSVFTLLFLQGCASIVGGTTQSISVETPGCDGARCELSNDKGRWFVAVTPGSVVVGRSYNNLQVVCSKGSVSGTPVSVASSTKGMAFGNILFGGVIGAGVDVNSGAAYDYPQSISVPLACAAPVSPETAGGTMLPPRLGMRVVRAPGAAAGLLITEVDPESLAARAGLRPLDRLLRANGTTLDEPEVLAQQLSALRGTWVLSLVVERDGQELTLQIESTPGRTSMRRQPGPLL